MLLFDAYIHHVSVYLELPRGSPQDSWRTLQELLDPAKFGVELGRCAPGIRGMQELSLSHVSLAHDNCSGIGDLARKRTGSSRGR